MLTIALAYYDSPNMLAEHLRAFWRYPPGVRVVVVDDGSPTRPADLTGCPIPYELWRVDVDRPWHQHGARNLAMTRADGPTLLTDIDHVLEPEDAHAAIHTPPDRGIAYSPRRKWPDGAPRGKNHPNTYLLNAADYWAAGGYDERLCGYYGTDARFRRQLQHAGVAIRDTARFALTLYEGIIVDANADLGRKGSDYHARRYPELRPMLTDASGTDAVNRLCFEYHCADIG